ncbi:hypothetical protein VTH06DRAFT_6210 [Thermothelomyces fergusii]
MARTGFFHHVGTFLLFAATVLLIVTCISAPVVNNLAILRVSLGGDNSEGSQINFGTFGYCLTIPDARDECTSPRVGYSPTAYLDDADVAAFSESAEDTMRILTRTMILHPIACGINFFAFLLALGAGAIGSFFASLVALAAFLATGLACVLDFVLFSILRRKANETSVVDARYGPAAWTTLASAICSLLGAIIVFFTCCSARLHRRRDTVTKDEYAPPRRRWLW